MYVCMYVLGPFQSPIRSMYLTSQERHLIVGLESGYVRILAQVGNVCMYVCIYVNVVWFCILMTYTKQWQDSEYLRRKLHKKLIETGILTL